MLHLICGPSSAGKTTRLKALIKQDIEHQKRCFFLAPEQQAYISELDLPTSLPQNAGLFFEVVSFSRLAEGVFRKHGGVTSESINTGIRSLLMWDTLRTLSPMLTQYGKSARSDLSLTAMMLETVDELKMSGMESTALEEAAAMLSDNNPLQKKITDLAMIEEMFSLKTQKAFGTDPSDKLIRMAQKLKEHRYFEGCNLYIDSFTGFTAQEYQIIYEILKQADHVTVALCTDHFHSKLPQFDRINETVRRLERLASKAGVECDRQLLPPTNTKKPKTLQILDRDLWRFELTRDERTLPPMGETDVLHLTVCNNLYEEAEAAALNILKLVQDGMKYGEIAIVMRDSESYRGVIDAAMERYHIPYFFSERTDLSSKPIARLIISALRAVEKNYQAQDIISLLKTGLTGVDLRDAALFEEYCETWHISGSRFKEDLWSMNPDGLTTERSARATEILDAANRVRQAVMTPLLALSAAMRASNRLTDHCRAVYEYLNALDISTQLSIRAKKELKNGQVREAGETLRLYQFIIETLSGINAFLPDSEMTGEEFIAALTLIFSTTDLGSVPNVHDCVFIGSANTMRVEKIRASLLLGLCEGEFPKAITDDGILSENDKATLETVGIVLDSRQDIRAAEELLCVYRAMTKPREKLFLSTVSSDPNGSAKTPSLAFSRVEFLFDMTPKVFDLANLRNYCNADLMQKQEKALSTTALPNGTTLKLSQSKIQTFLLCPYRYFSTYTLKLREKKDSTPSYADDGTFLHYVFEHFLRAAIQKDGSLELPAEDQVNEIADQILTNYLEEVCPFPPELLNSRLLHLFSRLRSMAVRMLCDMILELHMSRFVPSRFEQIIGLPGPDGLPPFTLMLKNGSKVVLTGKVDRVDFYQKDDKTFFRVVDYKSGKHEFSLRDVATGMEIQLLLYLFAVHASNPEQMIPAGAEYLFTSNQNGHQQVQRSGFIVDDPEIRLAMDQTEEQIFTKKLLLRTEEELKEMLDEMTSAVESVGERILSGEAQKTPSEDACRFCPIRLHCDKAYHN